jgi:hypothetical protein
MRRLMMRKRKGKSKDGRRMRDGGEARTRARGAGWDGMLCVMTSCETGRRC